MSITASGDRLHFGASTRRTQPSCATSTATRSAACQLRQSPRNRLQKAPRARFVLGHRVHRPALLAHRHGHQPLRLPPLPMMLRRRRRPRRRQLAGHRQLPRLLARRVACALQPTMWRAGACTGRCGARRWCAPALVATVLLTLGMALPGAALWPPWRGRRAWPGALVFVYVSGWCLARWRRAHARRRWPASSTSARGWASRQRHGRRGAMYGACRRRRSWAICALLAAVLTALARPQLEAARWPRAAAASTDDAAAGRRVSPAFTLAYGTAELRLHHHHDLSPVALERFARLDRGRPVLDPSISPQRFDRRR